MRTRKRYDKAFKAFEQDHDLVATIDPMNTDLLRGLDINRPNQLWRTDIKYIRKVKRFVCLLAIIDWYSRHALFWRLSTILDFYFCNEALKEELKKPGCFENLNSDKRDSSPVVRLWQSLQDEAVYLKAYENLTSCRKGIGEYFKLYSTQRPHQALKNQTTFQVFCDGLMKAANLI